MVCFVLIIVIMLQSGNAADLAGAFGGAGSQTAFGPRGAATFLSRATTWCAIVFMITSLTLSVKRTPTDVGTGSLLEQTSKAGTAPTKPAAPGLRRKRLCRFQCSRRASSIGTRAGSGTADAASSEIAASVTIRLSSNAVVAELADAPA